MLIKRNLVIFQKKCVLGLEIIERKNRFELPRLGAVLTYCKKIDLDQKHGPVRG